MRLEDSTQCTSLKGSLPNQIVAVVRIDWNGSNARPLGCRECDAHRMPYLRRTFDQSGITTNFRGSNVNFLLRNVVARAEQLR